MMNRLFLALLALLALGAAAHAQTSTLTVTASWQDNSNNEEGFILYRDGAKVGEVKANITQIVNVTTGNWGQQFCYQVSAFNHANADGTGAFQESAKSNTACTTVPTPTQPVPNAPSGLQIPSITATSLELKWQDNADNEMSQEIRIAQSRPPKEWTIPVAANVTNYSVTGLRKRTDYSAKVRAVGNGGVSAYSETITATTRR